jgi:hypothetical protein
MTDTVLDALPTYHSLTSNLVFLGLDRDEIEVWCHPDTFQFRFIDCWRRQYRATRPQEPHEDEILEAGPPMRMRWPAEKGQGMALRRR